MPKKFKGVNSKSEEARSRKDAIRVAEREKKQKEEEDRHWEDDDKYVARKQNRKDEKEKKKAEQLERKATAKQALQDEENQMISKAPTVPAKLTRSQIQSSKEKEEAAAAAAAAAASSSQKKKTVLEQELEENPNQAMAALLAAQGAVEARSVEDAIATLTVKDKLDTRPEKRQRAAYAEFEEMELPRLKKENPNLRLSQLKQMLKKDWMKSPDNPLNQQF